MRFTPLDTFPSPAELAIEQPAGDLHGHEGRIDTTFGQWSDIATNALTTGNETLARIALTFSGDLAVAREQKYAEDTTAHEREIARQMLLGTTALANMCSELFDLTQVEGYGPGLPPDSFLDMHCLISGVPLLRRVHVPRTALSDLLPASSATEQWYRSDSDLIVMRIQNNDELFATDQFLDDLQRHGLAAPIPRQTATLFPFLPSRQATNR